MRKSQATLETTIAFLLAVSLFFSIIFIWFWGDAQIAKRQPPFNESRVEAGVPDREPGASGSNKEIKWPTYTVSEEDPLEEAEVHF